MPTRIQLRRAVLLALAAVTGVLASKGVQTFMDFRPAAITLGPSTTIYFNDNPSVVTRVHEAIHRRQMKNKSVLGRLASAVRYNFDYGYRLDEEAEAKAGEICLQIHKFSDELPAYTTARSRAQAEVYRAWAWERIGPSVPDRVGEKLQHGERCHEILAGVALDLLPGEELTDEARLKLAAFSFLQSYGSTQTEVAKWKARLELAGLAEPAPSRSAEDLPPFWLIAVARPLAAQVDTTITATAAGEALHRLTYYRANRMYNQLQPTDPVYRHQVLVHTGEDESQLGMRMARWPVDLLPIALSGQLTDEESEWLTKIGEHPVHADFETFARAADADILGARYQLPVEGGWDRLVPTELGPVREAFQAQWGRAALAVHDGDFDRAEAVLQTVISGALQMERNAPFEVDVTEALGFLEQAMYSLADVQQARGGERPAWAERLDDGVPKSWQRGHRASLFADDAALVYHSLPYLVKDDDIPQAFKSFAYRQVVLFDVCLAQRQDYASQRDLRYWRERVESGLVRRESEAQVLQMMRQTVQDLLVASDVSPDSICAPSVVVRPKARFAIMSAPLRSLTASYPPLIAADYH
jgi:hypothetical protein